MKMVVNTSLKIINLLYFSATGFIADAEFSTTYDIFKHKNIGDGVVSLQVIRTVGTTDVISVDLQFCNDISETTPTWTSAISETGITKRTQAASTKLGRYWRVLITTVGNGNTLNIYVIIS